MRPVPAISVVDTGPWIFGSKVLIPAGAITDVDLVDEKVHLELSKEQIKNAPEYTPDLTSDDSYLGRLGTQRGHPRRLR
jgi:hypothetical protein